MICPPDGLEKEMTAPRLWKPSCVLPPGSAGKFRVCFTSGQPVFTSVGWWLVSNESSIPSGKPKLTTLSHSPFKIIR